MLGTGEGVESDCLPEEGEPLWTDGALAEFEIKRGAGRETFGLSILIFDGDRAESRDDAVVWEAAAEGASETAVERDVTEFVDDFRKLPPKDKDSRGTGLFDDMEAAGIPVFMRDTDEGDARARVVEEVVGPLVPTFIPTSACSITPKSEIKGEGGTSVLLLLWLDIELLFKLIRRELVMVAGLRCVDWGELVVELRPDMRGILVGVSFSL